MFRATLPIVASLAVASLAVTQTQASIQLLDFKPVPITNALPEVQWDISLPLSLTAAAGSASTGLVGPGVYDGDLAIGSQTPGGLQVGIALSMSGGRSPVSTLFGSTTYYDSSLTLTGLTASAPAINAAGTLIQPLSGSGPVNFLFADTAGNTLLQGTISNGVIVGVLGSTAGSALSGSVTYTGGLVYTALVNAGVTNFSGSMSFALNSYTPIVIAGSTIAPFAADAEGHFDIPAIPEPASLSLLAAPALLLRRRRA